MKRLIRLLVVILLSFCLIFGMTACNGLDDDGEQEQEIFKVGLICSGDEYDFYDYDFITAFRTVCQEKNVEFVVKTNVYQTGYSRSIAQNLINEGCDVIFANSAGYEEFMWELAGENPNVQFCQVAGIKNFIYKHLSHSKRRNFHNAYISSYKTKYLAGYAAGLKLNSMKDKAVENEFLVGYVTPLATSEYISSYTAWYLGLKASLDTNYTAKMQVYCTGDLFNEYAERTAVETLVENGVVLMGSETQSFVVSEFCNEAGIPHTGVNDEAILDYPETFILATKTDWSYYFDYVISKAQANLDFSGEWFGETGEGIYDGTSFISLMGDCAETETETKLAEVFEELKLEQRRVFDTSTFTVEGKKISNSLQKDLDADNDNDTSVVAQDFLTGISYFNECDHRSFPYFDLEIDGIEIIRRVS